MPLLAIILEAQLNRLDVLMGAQAGTYAAELKAPGEIPSVPSISTTANASDLLRRRPDIVAAERRFAALNARIGQAIAEYYPRVSLSGLLGSEAISPGDLFRERGFQPGAVAGLQPGEQIVALGAHLLSDGQHVRVADEKVASR